MKVILKSDVRNLGRVGDVVKVKDGYARNYLLPRGLVGVATERKMKELNHLMNMAKAKKAKMFASKKEMLDKICDTELTIKALANKDSEKLFGSITNIDIQTALADKGFELDKKDIVLESNIKTAGVHSVKVDLGEKLVGQIKVVVEKDTSTDKTDKKE